MDERRGAGYETSDMSVRTIVVLGISLIITAIVLNLALWGLFRLFIAQRERADVPPPPVFTARPLPPEPRLQSSPTEDLAKMRAEEDAFLTSYGWVDQRAGTVRIPIDRAMERILQQRLPAREGLGPEPIFQAPPGNLDSSGGRFVEDLRPQDRKGK